MNDLLTTREAADLLKVSDSRIRQLIGAGELPALLRAGTYFIDRADLGKVVRRPAGRPKQPKPETTPQPATEPKP